MSFARNKRWCSGLLALCLSTIVFAEERLLSEITVSAEVMRLEEQRVAVTQKTAIDRLTLEASGLLTVGKVLGKRPGVYAGVPSSDGSVNLRSRGMSRDVVQVGRRWRTPSLQLAPCHADHLEHAGGADRPDYA